MTDLTATTTETLQAPTNGGGCVATHSYGIEYCANCGKEFQKVKEKHYFCSDHCKTVDWEKKHPRVHKAPKRRSLSGHQSARMKNGEWLTPPEILMALGSFDLDPCAPVVSPWETAAKHYTVQDDGLAMPWYGRVWCNPPFGREAVKLLRRMRDHGNGIALIPARTETAMFYECVWGKADGVLFLKGRPHFHYADGRRADFNSGAPIALIAYGILNRFALENSGLGFVVNAK